MNKRLRLGTSEIRSKKHAVKVCRTGKLIKARNKNQIESISAASKDSIEQLSRKEGNRNRGKRSGKRDFNFPLHLHVLSLRRRLSTLKPF
jgi:hypothetical protein